MSNLEKLPTAPRDAEHDGSYRGGRTGRYAGERAAASG